MLYYFSWFMAGHTSLFIPIYQTALRITRPIQSTNEASNLQYKLWEIRDLTVKTVITTVYMCVAILCSLFLTFQTVVCNRPETELKCKIGFRTYMIYAFYHIQTVDE